MKILVVDDEPLHRRSFAAMLRRIDPANQLLEAGDGVQALQVLESAAVELVITDIRMPNMDGLQLLAEIRARYPATRVIILSVYSEFAYAKQALKDGAVDYVLKPVMVKEVRAALDNVTEAIEREKAERQKLDDTIPVYQEHLWNQALFAPAAEELAELAAALDFAGTGCLALARLPAAGDSAEGLLAALEAWCGLSGAAFRVRSHPGLYACVAPGNQYPGAAEAEALRERLEETAGTGVELAFSRLHTLPAEARAAFDEAKAALEFHFYQRGRPLYAHALEYESRQPISSSHEVEEGLCEQLSSGGLAAAREGFGGLVASLVNASPVLHPDLVRQAAAYCLLGVLRRFDNIFTEELRGSLVYEINSLQAACPTVTKLLEAGGEVLARIAGGIETQRQAVGVDRMESIRGYIDEHFHEDLSLTAVADLFFFNRSYFSTIFKSHVGKSFSDYLADIRMERAKALLADPANKVQEVAERVGYHDASYFARAFKRKTGFAPEEYRRLEGKGL